MNYRQTLDYLYSQLPMFQRIGAAAYKADLGNTIAMCNLLENPENDFKSVHIAGTNGKGSTSHLIASVLQSAGYKTGLFTSPHLKDFRERIRIDGKKIPKSYVTAFVTTNKKKFEGIRLSFFEYTAVMAFQYFKDEKVDVAVMETGMGGRLDSTNVITPLVSIITNISNDHMAYLGNSLSKIAYEKAGIIKPGVPVVIGETQPETSDVFSRKAADMKARIFFADQNFKLTRKGPGKRNFFISPGDGIQMASPLAGFYQDKNLLTAYQAILVLRDRGITLVDEEIRQGFKKVVKQTGLQGRWQTLRRKPRVICDIGHNEAGIKYIIAQLESEDYKNLHWVFGMVNDKDADGVLRLLPPGALYYFCKANIPRGMDATELREKAKKYGLSGKVYPTVQDAYGAALEAAGEKDLVFVGGSTFVVAEVI